MAVKLPFIKVATEVIWTNSEFPVFKLSLDEESHLGFMVNLDPKNQPSVGYLETLPLHGRSALLGRVFFRANDGTLYHEIDLKGIGYIQWLAFRPSPTFTTDSPHQNSCPFGLANRDWVEHNIQMVELLKMFGVRVCPTIAVLKLLEIPDRQGRPISIEKAKVSNIIASGREPVIEVRAFTTKARIANISYPYCDSSQTLPLLENAKALVAQEISKETLSLDEYLDWFAENLARQLAIIHNLGFEHGYLTVHNITLDCRLVDFDSVKKVRNQTHFLLEKHQALTSLNLLIVGAVNLDSQKLIPPFDHRIFDRQARAREIFRETYQKI